MAQYHRQNAAGFTENYTNNPYAPPVYSPFQNAAHVDDAFGYMANMYGPSLVQGAFGPDAFLAHQAPGQALADQFTASRYQRHGMQAIAAANMAGNEQVAQKLLGVQRGGNGGQPITDLDREHANIGARVLNNPIFKQFAASQIGAENLEGLMFGRRGDPTAIAAATNRIGFFRPDAGGQGPRMSADSLQQFSQNVYQNLYGPDANLDEMHGFGATASGEMMETLFQQGRLPQSIGALSAADRVNTLSKTKRDDKTMNKLARQFGHSELTARDAAYAGASEEEQKIMLADKLPGFRERLDSTFTEIDKFKDKDPRSKSAEEIQQLSGFGLASNAIDAQSVSKAVKDYNGAISAIREIFGDNGNPGAPIQELIASLQHLTNGAQGSMTGGKVESLVREIRLAARDTNTDMQNLNAIAAEKKAMARGLGLQEVTAEKGLAGDLLRGQAMADAGVFEKPGFGKLNRADAEARVAAMSTRGDASSVGRSLATMNRLVTENPDKYKGTQMAAAMEAYRRGDSKYEHDGRSFNLAEQAGRDGVQGLFSMARESGADQRLFRAYMTDQIGTEEYMKAGYAYKAQRFELQRDLSRAHGGALVDRMRSAEFQNLKPAGMSDKEFSKKNSALASGFANKMTGIMIDETADMTPEERVKTLEKRGKEELVKYFKSSEGGGLKGAAADQAAEKHFNALYGANESARRDSLLATYSETSTISQQRTGLSLEAHKQGHSQTVDRDVSTKEEMNRRRADRFKLAARGTESGMMQRVGDELERLGSDNAGVRTESLKRIFNIASEDSLLQSYAPDMQEGLVAAARMYTQASVTEKQIDTLADAAQKDPNSAEAKQLKIMAGVDPGKKLSAEELGELRNSAKMKSADMAAGKTDAEKQQNEQQRNRADLIMRGFNTGKTEDVQAAAKAMARHTLGARATTAQIEQLATAALATNTENFEKQLNASGMSDEKKQEARSMAQGLQTARDIGGLVGAGLEQTPVDVAKAQNRPQARENRAAADLRQSIYTEMDKGHDKKEYEKLRPKDMKDREFEKYRRTNVARLSSAMATFTTGNIENLAGKDKEDRALAIATGSIDQMAQQLVAAGMPPEDAKVEAKKQFNAVIGRDKDAVVARLNRVFESAVAARKNHGYDNIAVAADTATAEQQQLVEELGKDPTGKAFETALTDDKKKQQILTLPNADAVKLFDKMNPDAQQKALTQFQRAIRLDDLGLTGAHKMSPEQMAHVRRIHGAISESKTGAGVSSKNITPEQARRLNQQGHAPASGHARPPSAEPASAPSAESTGPTDTISNATHTQSRADALGEIQRELAEIEERNKDNTSFFGGITYSKEDGPRRAELIERHTSMTFGGKKGDGAGDIQEFKIHDPFDAMDAAAGQSFSLRELRGLDERHLFGGYQDVSERVFVPYSQNYTEEEAALDVDRYGTKKEKAEFLARGGAKKVNVKMEDGGVQQVVEKPHMRLIAEEALFEADAKANNRDPREDMQQRFNELEKKKKYGFSGVYFKDDKDHARYNFLQDTIAQYDEAQAAGSSGGGGGGSGQGGSGEMSINGTLILQGLSEAIMQATGQRMEDTPDNGPSVDMANGTGANHGR